MTFSSSSKNNSLAGKSGKANNNKNGELNHGSSNNTINSQLSASKKSSSGYESGGPLLPSKTSKPLPMIPTNNGTLNRAQASKSITKADISGPIPISNARHISKTNRLEETVDDTYSSCSECGGVYESVCPSMYDDTCSSCRVKMSPNVVQQNVSNDTESDIYCEECDGDSCISSEKCYCSLRGTNQLNHKVKVKPRIQLPEVHNCHNNKTIIHCNGSSGRDTISSIGSSVTSCSTCIHNNTDSGSTATDTTCYSIKHTPIHGSHSHNLLSGCETPQTAWRKNNKRLNPHRQDHHSCCSDYSSDSPLGRRNSGGSGYHSNDSNGMHIHNRIGSVCGSSSCSNSSSGCSQRSGATVLSARNHGHNMKRANSKVLLLSAVDKAGNVSNSRKP